MSKLGPRPLLCTADRDYIVFAISEGLLPVLVKVPLIICLKALDACMRLESKFLSLIIECCDEFLVQDLLELQVIS